MMVSRHRYQNFLKIWHFHEEFELVLILQSSGTRLVGDSVERFDVGDLVLIGKDVPHMWLNDEEYFETESPLMAEAIAVHFKREFLGAAFFAIPEMRQVSNLLDRAERGLKFSGLDATTIEKVKNLDKLDASAIIVSLIEILDDLSKCTGARFLSSTGFTNTYHKTENKRLDLMYAYVFENFKKPISSSVVAEAIGMNKSAFSRFFKKNHRKSFTRYLNEIRVGYACKLLMEGNESVTGIAYLSGYNNISNFNRQFKAIKGRSPSAYTKMTFDL